MPVIFASPAELLGQEGRDLGVTEWLAIDQRRIDGFAEATEDRQWIHVDPARAKAGPFGATIAHGYLTLGLFAHFLPQLIDVRQLAMGINVGLDRLRFLAPVRVDARIRGQGTILGAEEIKGAVQLTTRLTVQIEGEDKPACVGDVLGRYFPA
ncbi:MaoC family dehydratase [Flavisphingomonas formosensis]|uniref:MaoC family dehydratase n=1 Tax=Flavisphingomonas formosensis TaxID=861534 RepID=UPI0012FA4235|nr:MaoC family dehydratase [Sphingomonas formosensis]